MSLSPAHIAVLACPVCQGGLTGEQRVLACASGHQFDVARQGHVTLTASPIRHPGDTADMLDARTTVQQAGLQAPLTAALAVMVPPSSSVIVDLGAGTGHHLAAVVEGLPNSHGIAVDSSRYAGRRAARAHPRVGSIVADVQQRLPLRDGMVDAVLSAFAPRPGPEIVRILRPGGTLVVLTPRPDHLVELVAPLDLLTVAEDKADRLTASLPSRLELADHSTVGETIHVDGESAAALVSMGPNAYHRSAEEIAAAVRGLDLPTDVTLSADVWRYTLV